MRRTVGRALQGVAIAVGVVGAIVGLPVTMPVVAIVFVPGYCLVHGERF